VTEVNPVWTRVACTVILWVAIAAPAVGQSVRDTIAGARLGSGYAAILNLTATPDISSARYVVDGGDTQPSIDVLRVFPTSLAGSSSRATPRSTGGLPGATCS